MKIKKFSPKFAIYFVIFIIIAFCIVTFYNRTLQINAMFALYDLYAAYGLYWQTVPHHCSPFVNGFEPIMPLEFYADFNKAIFPRIPVGDNTLNREEIIRICDRNLKWLQTNGKCWDKSLTMEVLHVDAPDFKTKIAEHMKMNLPYVIRGLKLACFENMQFDRLMAKVGNNKVYMSPNGSSNTASCPENTFTEFKRILENNCYVRNSTNLFYHYTDLLPDSDMQIIKEAIDGYMSNDSKQLFVSVAKDSGTALHAAYTNNFFLMIQGRKRWTLFNPNHLALLYPNFQKSGIYMANECRFVDMELDRDRMAAEFPLILYAPRYEIELEEGDVLYNPKSWFHSVHNLTDVSVACSTRWSNTVDSIPDAHMLRYAHMINPHLREYVKEIYVDTGVLGISQIDEHKHMIGQNDPDALPFWDKNTNNGHTICRDVKCSPNWHKIQSIAKV